MRLKRGNVEREAEGFEIQKLIKDGYETVKNQNGEKDEEQKGTQEMTLEELRKLANEKGLKGASSLKKQELLEILAEE